MNVPSRQEWVSFTPPYLIIHEEILAFIDSCSRSIKDCVGKKAAVAKGSFMMMLNLARQFPGIQQVLTKSNAAGIGMLLSGEVQYIANNDSVFKKLLEKIDAGQYDTSFTSANNFKQCWFESLNI
jgi:ABC-type amino acid transport substrate-binding protein